MVRIPPLTFPPFLQPLVQAWAIWITTTFVSIPLAFFYAFWDFPLSILRFVFATNPKTIFITGASSGIGAEFAFTYAEKGVTLGLLARNKDRLERVASACEKKGAKVEVIECDVANHDELVASIEQFDDDHPIDLVIANAGVAGETIPEKDGKEWEEIYEPLLNVNLLGAIATAMTAFKRMKGRNRGQIAIVSSVAGIFATPHMCYYNASKAALNSFGRDLRYLARNHNIKVNVVCPGWISSHLSLEPNQPIPIPDWFSSSPASLAVLTKIQLRENWSQIFWPFTESLPATMANAIPPRVADTIHYGVGKVWGIFSSAGDRGFS